MTNDNKLTVRVHDLKKYFYLKDVRQLSDSDIVNLGIDALMDEEEPNAVHQEFIEFISGIDNYIGVYFNCNLREAHTKLDKIQKLCRTIVDKYI